MLQLKRDQIRELNSNAFRGRKQTLQKAQPSPEAR